MAGKSRHPNRKRRSKPPIHPPTIYHGQVFSESSVYRQPISFMRCGSYNDVEIERDASCHSPLLSIFAPSKPSKTTFVEWKTAPNKRKKKKSTDSLSEVHSLPLPHEDSSQSSNRSTNSYQQYHETTQSSVLAEIAPNSRTSNVKFKALSNFYSENQKKVSEITSRAGVNDNLLKMRRELADLRRWAQEGKDRMNARKKVKFAETLISKIGYRPKTKPEDMDQLYFREDDLLDWEEDRETTSPEQVECMIREDARESLQVAFDYRSPSFDT